MNAALAKDARSAAGGPGGWILAWLKAIFFNRPSANRAIELDAIRGFAIVLAVGSHLNRPTGNRWFDLIQTPGERWGGIGVDIFFVLSGFLIGGLIIREIDQTGGFAIRRFLVRRAFRLWPVLYLFVIAHMIFKPDPVLSYAPQIFFHVQNYFRTPLYHLWSLAVEEQFYLLAATLLPFVARRQFSTGPLLMGLGALALASALLRTVAWYHHVDGVSLQWQTQYRADVLLAGIMLGVIRFRHIDVYRRIQGARWPWLILGLACMWGLDVVAQTPDQMNLTGRPLALMLGVALILGLDGWKARGPVLWLMRPLAFMGLYSYSIYIWHPGIGRALITRVADKTGSLPLGILAGYLLVVALSFVITRVVERPMMALRDRLFPSTLHG